MILNLNETINKRMKICFTCSLNWWFGFRLTFICVDTKLSSEQVQVMVDCKTRTPYARSLVRIATTSFEHNMTTEVSLFRVRVCDELDLRLGLVPYHRALINLEWALGTRTWDKPGVDESVRIKIKLCVK